MLKYFINQTRINMHFACEYPNVCPICGDKISPNHLSDYFNEHDNLVSVFFVCPSCGKTFMGDYTFDKNNQTKNINTTYYLLNFIESLPKIPNKIHFDECIETLSNNFYEIYNQAHASEIYGLNQLSGIGYRKSLEFLIKDYCIHYNPNDKDKIERMNLSQVITEYVSSDKIKNLSKASAWIGNDETHYIRKFQDKDINDLKRFISSTVAFITYELTSDEAETFVNS